MKRINTLVAKMTTIERFSNGDVSLANEGVALTGLFNNFLRYLLDEWAIAPITKDEAPALALRVLWYMRRPEGIRTPTSERIGALIAAGDVRILPLLMVRYLLRNRHLRVEIAHTTSEWTQFIQQYQNLITNLDVGMFEEDPNAEA